MKTDVNPPVRSKINWAAGIQSLANVGVWLMYAAGWIPKEAVVDALVVGNTASAGLIFVFRTFFTKP